MIVLDIISKFLQNEDFDYYEIMRIFVVKSLHRIIIIIIMKRDKDYIHVLWNSMININDASFSDSFITPIPLQKMTLNGNRILNRFVKRFYHNLFRTNASYGG